jgi:hypothetical protein
MLRIPRSATPATINPVMSKPSRAFGIRDPREGMGLKISIGDQYFPL